MEAEQTESAASSWFGPTPATFPPRPSSPAPVPMEQALQAAHPEEKKIFEQHRAQDDLLRRMNEALRASSSTSVPVVPAPRPSAPSSWSQASPKPLILGPANPATEGDGDLWNIVQTPSAAPRVTSFEEALKRADSNLEQLVGRAAPNIDDFDAPIIEASVEAVIEPASRNDDTDDLLGDPSDPAEASRLRRQRLLRRAMENMGTMPTNRTPLEQAPIPSEAPTAPAVAIPVETTAPTLSEGQLAKQIDTRLTLLQTKKELYSILGIQVGAGKDQIKTAFLTLAKIFHPDRLPASLPHYQEKMTLVFESIREAYETLYDDAKRAAYMSNFASASNAPPPRSQAAGQADDLMKMGEVFFKKRDYRAAEDHFARAYAKDKKGVALAAQAWAIYMDPTRKSEANHAKDLMASALRVDPQCDRAHYQLGVIARVEGDINKAENHFKQAVQLNPRHLEANQEIRLIDMRKKKAETKKGFFK